MAQAPKSWPDRIAAVSDDYKNAVISIINPALSVVTNYDPVTGVRTTTGNPVVASGIPARIQPVRLAVDYESAAAANVSAEVRVRIQIPRTAYSGRIEHGWRIRVTSADRNPELTQYLFTVDGNVNSSWRASNTIEATANVENVVS